MVNNTTPWQTSTAYRKEQALLALKAGKKLALLLYPHPDSTTLRYRGYNLFKATQQSKKWQLVYFFLDEINVLAELIPKCSLLVYARLYEWEYKLDELAVLAHSFGIAVVNELDDCLCGTKHIKDLFNTISPDQEDCYHWIKSAAHHELVASVCDGFITTNDYLGKILSGDYNKPYQVIPNSLNQEQIEFSHKLTAIKQSSRDQFIIGYFSGSATHATDFNVVYPEILQVLDDYPNINLQIVGFMKLPESAQLYIKSGRIKFLPIVNFLELQRCIAEVDVNIAPLIDNVFTNCKSELKFFEAAIVKTPTIASPTYTFQHSIKPNQTGFLCQPGQWYDTIVKLYKERALATKVADCAHDYCLKTYSPDAILPQIEKTYDYFAKLCH